MYYSTICSSPVGMLTLASDGNNLSLNKIAARWPAKAMAQFFFTL